MLISVGRGFNNNNFSNNWGHAKEKVKDIVQMEDSGQTMSQYLSHP